jgi:hypothetical protein
VSFYKYLGRVLGVFSEEKQKKERFGKERNKEINN